MNERIKELKEQAMDWVPNMADPTTKIRLLNTEKFAELIVRECVQAVDNVGGYNEEFHMNAIKAHFGVE